MTLASAAPHRDDSAMSASPVIVLGSINTDLVIRSPALPRVGETVLGGEFYRALGGKGANQAVAAARVARAPVLLLASVGDDEFGTTAVDVLSREQLDMRFVKIVPGQPSGVAVILVDHGGHNLISVANGANQQLRPADIDLAPLEAWRQARVFLACCESPWDTVVAGLHRARLSGLLTIVNPAPADSAVLSAARQGLIDVLTPNEVEAALLAGCELDSAPAAAAAARRLQSVGFPRVIITRGAQGCCVLERDEVTHVPARPVQAVDAVAAGDVFNGVLAVALAEGRSLVEAARWAGAAATLSVTRRGAQPSIPHREEIAAACD
jgi:ribokinase